MHLSNTGSITKSITKFTSPGSIVTVQVTIKEMKMNESNIYIYIYIYIYIAEGYNVHLYLLRLIIVTINYKNLFFANGRSNMS